MDNEVNGNYNCFSGSLDRCPYFVKDNVVQMVRKQIPFQKVSHLIQNQEAKTNVNKEVENMKEIYLAGGVSGD